MRKFTISFNVLVAGEMIIANDKYNMTEINSSYYSVQMRLTVRNFRKSDFGGYKCISKNSIGDAEGNIRLYGEYFFYSEHFTRLMIMCVCPCVHVCLSTRKYSVSVASVWVPISLLQTEKETGYCRKKYSCKQRAAP